MKSFKQFNEEKKREVVFTFGRFNPPTIGHGKLLAKVAAAAIGNDYRIYASQSSDAISSKINKAKKLDKVVMKQMLDSSMVITIIESLIFLQAGNMKMVSFH